MNRKIKSFICRIVLMALFICGFNHLFAQTLVKILGHSADTIYPKLINASDLQKMKAFNQLAFYHSLYDADSALYYAEKAFQMAVEFEDEPEKCFAMRNMGNAYALAGNYRLAMINLHKALEIAETRNDQRRMMELYLDIGKVNYDIEDYTSSLKYVDLFMAILNHPQTELRSIISPIEEAIIYFYSGGAAREARELDRAVRYFKKYIELSRKHNFPEEMNRHAIKSLAETYEYADEYDSALKYTYTARAILPVNKNNDSDQHVGYEGAIGYLLYKKGRFDEALELVRVSYFNIRQSASLYYMTYEAIDLGAIYFSLNQYDSALYWYNIAQSHADEFANQLRSAEKGSEKQNVYVGYQYMVNINDEEIIQRFYRMMRNLKARYTALYKATGNYAKALEYSELRSSYDDSLKNLINQVEIRKVQIRLESEKLVQQLNLLEKDNLFKQTKLRKNSLIFLSVILLLLFVLLLFFIYFRQRRIRESQEKILLEQRLLRSQMNPHFIFNSLASVQNFIVKQDETKASIYLSRFSELVRSILNNSLEEQITLEREINTIQNYLELQKVRFPEKFDYSLHVDDSLDIENTFIPPMMAQPFIENAIEHGIKHKVIKGNISISFKRQNHYVELVVEDNGIGREKAKELLLRFDKDHKSLATSITLERIKVLNRKHKRKITLEIIDLKGEYGEAKGTRVVFQVPMF